METILQDLIEYGLLLVFANVFLEQIGAPIPALPTLILGGALTVRGEMDLLPLVGAALAGSVLADMVWYFIGRWQGRRILKTVCRLSLSPDSCVRGTEDLFERAGMSSLLYAKFIPGYNTVAPPLSGAMGASLLSFLFWDALGCLLWIGLGVGTGIVFHRAVERAIGYLETLGFWALIVIAVALAVVIAVKWWQRRRVRKMLELARISADELKRMLDSGEAPVILDVRNRSAQRHDPRRIPGAIRMALDEVEARIPELPQDRNIVLYCA